jgi:uncharacterized membrane protein
MGGGFGPGVGPGGMGWDDAAHGAHTWWEAVGAIVPSILLLILIGVVVWGVFRLLHAMTPAPAASIPAVPAGAVAGSDPALAQLRLRYARGEVDRQAFLDATRDLGGDGGESSPGAP